GGGRERDVVLEVAVRRWYRIRDLVDLTLVDARGVRMAVAGYAPAGRDHHLMVAFGPAGTLPEIVRGVAAHLAGSPEQVRPVIDVHLWHEGEPRDVEAVAEALRGTLTAGAFGRPVH